MPRLGPATLWLVLALCAGCDRIEGLREKLMGGGASKQTEPTELMAGRELYESGQLAAAIERLEAYTASDPGAAEGFYYLGLSYLASAGSESSSSEALTPEEEKALGAFQRTLALNPRHALASVGIGDLYLRRVPARRRRGGARGDPAQDPFQLAQQAYQNAVTIDPKLPAAQAAYAGFLARAGEFEQAEQAYRAAAEAAATTPETAPDYYVAYGRFLASRPGRDQEAIDQFELAKMFRQEDTEIQREIARLHARLGLGYFENEQFALAEQSLNRAYQLFPDKNDPEAVKVTETLRQLRVMRGR